MSETELFERLERLERAHRRLKGFALAALVLATALVTIHAMQPVPERITAHEFDVIDSSQKLRMIMGANEIELHDAEGNAVAGIAASFGGEPTIWLTDAHGKSAQINLADGPEIWLGDLQNKSRVTLTAPPDTAPALALMDSDGYSTIIGGTDTVTPQTGQKHTTSAASIVMFGNDKEHHVIWQAP